MEKPGGLPPMGSHRVGHDWSDLAAAAEEEEREKGPEKIFEEIIAKNFPNMGKEISQPSPGSTESPRQDKPKEEHTMTHSNQTDKN